MINLSKEEYKALVKLLKAMLLQGKKHFELSEVSDMFGVDGYQAYKEVIYNY